jgi:hypothetical protein
MFKMEEANAMAKGHRHILSLNSKGFRNILNPVLFYSNISILIIIG